MQLLAALLHGRHLETAVPAVLVIVERDALASAGCFRGDLLRGLMQVRNEFWRREPSLYERYRCALRRAAALRRALPDDARMEFWSAMELDASAKPYE